MLHLIAASQPAQHEAGLMSALHSQTAFWLGVIALGVILIARGLGRRRRNRQQQYQPQPTGQYGPQQPTYHQDW